MEQEDQNKIEEGKAVSTKKQATKSWSPWTVTICVVGGIVIIGAIACAGAVAVKHRVVGRFDRSGVISEEFSGNYSRMGRGGMMGGSYREVIGRNSIDGKITAVNGDTLTVNANNKDYTVNIQDATEIYNGTSIASKSDLKAEQSVIVRGRPNSSGQINANIIEIE